MRKNGAARAKAAVFALAAFALAAPLFRAEPAGAAAYRVLAVFHVPDGSPVAKGVLEEAVKEVMATGASYEYASVEDVARAWFPGEKDGPENVGYLAPAALFRTPEFTAWISEKEKIWPVDMILLSAADKDRQLGRAEIHAMLINISNGRYSEAGGIYPAEDAGERLRAMVKGLLAKGPALRKVEADREADAASSAVAYELKSEDGRPITVRVKHSDERVEPSIEDVSIMPADCREGEARTYRLLSRDGKSVEISGVCRSGRLENVVPQAASSGISPGAGEKSGEEVITVVSEGGYALNFILHWKGAQLKALRIEPLVDPYGKVE
jgi:hypothetical protein